MKRIDQIAGYLRCMEELIYGSDSSLPGWEVSIAKSRGVAASPGLASSQRLFWRVLTVFSVLGSIYGFLCQQYHFWS